MTRLNLEPLMTFSDGSHLVISTECSKDGEFSCVLYRAVVEIDDRAVFQVVSTYLLSGSTCLSAQAQAYSCALRLYPTATESMKKPPYLIWHRPPSAGIQ